MTKLSMQTIIPQATLYYRQDDILYTKLSDTCQAKVKIDHNGFIIGMGQVEPVDPDEEVFLQH